MPHHYKTRTAYNDYMRTYMRQRRLNGRLIKAGLDDGLIMRNIPRKNHIAVYLTELEIKRLDATALAMQLSRSEWAAQVLRAHGMAGEAPVEKPLTPKPIFDVISGDDDDL